MRTLWNATIAAALFVMLGGCSGGDGLPREAVSGSVSFEGKPLAKGLITFLPAEGELPTQGGGAIVEGAYSLPRAEGLVPGKYRVVITSAGAAEKSKDTASAAPGMPAPLPKEALPAEYNSKSKLTADVKEGAENRFEFALENSSKKK